MNQSEGVSGSSRLGKPSRELVDRPARNGPSRPQGPAVDLADAKPDEEVAKRLTLRPSSRTPRRERLIRARVHILRLPETFQSSRGACVVWRLRELDKGRAR